MRPEEFDSRRQVSGRCPSSRLIFVWPRGGGRFLRQARCPFCYRRLRQTSPRQTVGATILEKPWPRFAHYMPPSSAPCRPEFCAEVL